MVFGLSVVTVVVVLFNNDIFVEEIVIGNSLVCCE